MNIMKASYTKEIDIATEIHWTTMGQSMNNIVEGSEIIIGLKKMPCPTGKMTICNIKQYRMHADDDDDDDLPLSIGHASYKLW